jgi:probable rRNA maturation factor
MLQFQYQTAFKLKEIRRIKKLINTISEEEAKVIESLSIVFTTDDYLLELNQKYLSHNYYTDIITFDYGSTSSVRLNGELYISIDRARDNAKEFKDSVQNELRRLIIHGILHLVGYKDKTAEEKSIMTNKENYFLSKF